MMRRANSRMLVAAGAVDARCRSCGTRRRYAFHGMAGPYHKNIPTYTRSALLPSPYNYADESLCLKEAYRRAYKIHPSVQSDVDIKKGFSRGARRSAIVRLSIR